MTPEEKAVIDSALYLRYCIDAGTAGDPPRIGRLLDYVDNLIFSCPKCNAGGHVCPGDGNSISHTATDCGEHEEPARDEPVWVETAWKYVRRGDTVRMRDGGTPAEVQRICVQEFGQNIESRWSEDYGRWFDNYKGAWEHLEVSVRLSLAPEKIIPFPPNAAVQVLMNAERRAIHLVTEQLGGTEIPDSAPKSSDNCAASAGGRCVNRSDGHQRCDEDECVVPADPGATVTGSNPT